MALILIFARPPGARAGVFASPRYQKPVSAPPKDEYKIFRPGPSPECFSQIFSRAANFFVCPEYQFSLWPRKVRAPQIRNFRVFPQCPYRRFRAPPVPMPNSPRSFFAQILLAQISLEYYSLEYCSNDPMLFFAQILRANIARPEKRASGKKSRGGCSGHKTGISAASPRQNAHSVHSGGGDFRGPGAHGFIPHIFSRAPDFFVRPGKRFFCLPRKRLRALDSSFGAPPLKLALMFWARPQISRSPQRTIICPQCHRRAIILGVWNIRETAKRCLARWREKGGRIPLAQNEVSARINAPWAQSRPMSGAIWNRSSPQPRELNMFYEDTGWNQRDAHRSEGGGPFSACYRVIPTSGDAWATFGPFSLS